MFDKALTDSDRDMLYFARIEGGKGPDAYHEERLNLIRYFQESLYEK